MIQRIIIVSILIGITSCSSSIEGEGPATAQNETAVEQFNEVEIDCNCDVTLIPSESSHVVVESHQNLIDNYQIVFNRGTLKLSEKSPVSKFNLYNVNVYFNSDLKKIKLKNKTRFKVSGTLKTDNLDLEVSNKAEITQSFMEIKDFQIKASDHSKIQLNGTVIDLKVKAMDKSNVNLSNLQAVSIDLTSEDDSELLLNVLKNIKGTAGDNSKVFYKGDPVKDIKEIDRASILQN